MPSKLRRFAIPLTTCAALAWVAIASANAEDGYDLWLRYAPLDRGERERVAARITSVVAPGEISATRRAALDELSRGLAGLLGAAPPAAQELRDGALVVATPAQAPDGAALDRPLEPLGDDGYLLKRADVDGHDVTVLTANTDIGLLYGAFALLRRIDVDGRLD